MRESASRPPSDLLAIPACIGSLGSVKDALNYNWDYTYANDFPPRLTTSTWPNQDHCSRESGPYKGALLWLEGFPGFESRMVMFKVKVRLHLVAFPVKSAGRAPSLRIIPWDLP